MPVYKMGDIFQEGLGSGYDLALVFGQYGLNELGFHWNSIKQGVPQWQQIEDPFKISQQPIIINGKTKLWWFVSAEENGGLSDSRNDLKHVPGCQSLSV